YFLVDMAQSDDVRELLRRESARSENDPDLAIPRMTERLRGDRNDIDALRRRGAAWKTVGQYERALADFERLTQLQPDDPYAHGDRARIWACCPDVRFRDPQQAIASAKKAYRLDRSGLTIMWDQEKGEVYMRTEFVEALAAAHASAGEFEQACEVLR